MRKSLKREAVIQALLASPHLAAAAIAKQVGCARSYTSAVMAATKSQNGCILTPTFVGANGRTYQRRVLPPRTAAAVAQRHAKLRAMAADGHNPQQIADSLGISVTRVKHLLLVNGLTSPIRVTSRTRHHNAVRIVEHIVMDAEGLTTEVKLINFATLPATRVPDWIASLEQARLDLGTFIRQLRRIYETNGRRTPDRQATDTASVESPASPVEDDAGASGGVDPT